MIFCVHFIQSLETEHFIHKTSSRHEVGNVRSPTKVIAKLKEKEKKEEKNVRKVIQFSTI